MDLCNSIDQKAVHSYDISPLTARCLIALDKCPGIRPIGVGVTLRHPMSTAVLQVTRDDILKAVGSQQLCTGQESACEATIHAIEDAQESIRSLLVDASNAFNSLNNEATLRNTHIL